MAFDMDVDVKNRFKMPKFYGYIPDDNFQRGQCFALMTLISMFHNISRSVALALVMVSSGGGGSAALAFYGREVAVLMLYKGVRGDLFYWPRMKVSERKRCK